MIQPGMVVCAKKGHDKGRFYVVQSVEGNQAWLADGKTRMINHPKLKNVRHIAPTRTILASETMTTDRAVQEKLALFARG